MNRKLVYVDLDDTIADFYNSAKGSNDKVDIRKMYDPDFFYNLKPVPGALKTIRLIQYLGFDVHILTQPLSTNYDSYRDKAKWVQMWCPELFEKLTMTQHKGNCLGHYLIDDNLGKWKTPFESNGGKFIHYPYKQIPGNLEYLESEWEKIAEFFSKENPSY